MNKLSNLLLGLMSLGTLSFSWAQASDQSSFGPINSQSDLVCLLTGPELRERLQELKSEVFHQLQGIEEIEAGYIFRFPDEQKFILKLVDYVMAERSCCPFFQFDLSLAPEGAGVTLQVTGPPGAKALLTASLKDMN